MKLRLEPNPCQPQKALGVMGDVENDKQIEISKSLLLFILSLRTYIFFAGKCT